MRRTSHPARFHAVSCACPPRRPSETVCVDLDDEAVGRPAEVGLLAGDPAVELGQPPSSVTEELDRTDLGAASRSLEREARVPGDHGRQSSRPSSTAVLAEGVADCNEGGALEPYRFPHCPGKRALTNPPGEIEQCPRHPRDRDAVELGAI